MKKFIKIILILLGVYILIWSPTILSAYKDKVESDKREENALEIMNVLNDPLLSDKEKDSKLQELYNVSDDGVGTNGVTQYELSDKSTTKEYRKLEDILNEYDFTITESTNDTLAANYKHETTFVYKNANKIKNANFTFTYDNIENVNLSKNKAFKKIIDILEIENLKIDDEIKNFNGLDDEINVSLKNGWYLNISKVDDSDMEIINDGWGNFGSSTSDNESQTNSNILFINFTKNL